VAVEIVIAWGVAGGGGNVIVAPHGGGSEVIGNKIRGCELVAAVAGSSVRKGAGAP
jgi:hypothetical protein